MNKQKTSLFKVIVQKREAHLFTTLKRLSSYAIFSIDFLARFCLCDCLVLLSYFAAINLERPDFLLAA